MDDITQQQHVLLSTTLEHLAQGTEQALVPQLSELPPPLLADLLESLPVPERKRLWALLAVAQQADVLPSLRDEVRATLIEEMETRELITAAEGLSDDDLTEVIVGLPEELIESILGAMDADRRARLERVLEFPPDTAGRLANSDVISVRADVSVAVVLRYLRRLAPLPDDTDAVMVVDNDGRYRGTLPLAQVVGSDPDVEVGVIMRTELPPFPATAPQTDVAVLFERHDLLSAPVVDDAGQLLGRITVDDVIDIIREEAGQALLKQAGLREEQDLFAPVVSSARRRAVWLGINLATVLAAAWVIGRFEHVLDKIVALAILMPVVASMGGIAGSQTLTLTIRGLALNQVSLSNVRWLARKEVAIGLLNGLLWAVVIAVVAGLWFHNRGIALVIGAAVVVNLGAAAVSGVLIPMVLRRMGIDPALAGAVVLTTVTDIVGFAGFLGMATIFLL